MLILIVNCLDCMESDYIDGCILLLHIMMLSLSRSKMDRGLHCSSSSQQWPGRGGGSVTQLKQNCLSLSSLDIAVLSYPWVRAVGMSWQVMTIDGDEPGVEKFLLLAGQHVITCVQNWWRGTTEGYALTDCQTWLLLSWSSWGVQNRFLIGRCGMGWAPPRAVWSNNSTATWLH